MQTLVLICPNIDTNSGENVHFISIFKILITVVFACE